MEAASSTNLSLDEMSARVARGRRRSRFVAALGAASVFAVFVEGASLWRRFPDRFPVHFDILGRPDGWVAKSFLSVFFLLLLAAALLIAFSLPTFLRFRKVRLDLLDKQTLDKLPEQAKDYLFAPSFEALAWLGFLTASCLSLVAHESFLVALGQRPAIPPAILWLAALLWLPVVIVAASITLGRASAVRRSAVPGEVDSPPRAGPVNG